MSGLARVVKMRDSILMDNPDVAQRVKNHILVQMGLLQMRQVVQPKEHQTQKMMHKIKAFKSL